LGQSGSIARLRDVAAVSRYLNGTLRLPGGI
jgi:hypothetical protein